MCLKFDILYMNTIEDSITLDAYFYIKFYRPNVQIAVSNTSLSESSKLAGLFSHK